MGQVPPNYCGAGKGGPKEDPKALDNDRDRGPGGVSVPGGGVDFAPCLNNTFLIDV